MHSQVCLCMSPVATQPSPVLQPVLQAGSSKNSFTRSLQCQMKLRMKYNLYMDSLSFRSKNTNEKGSSKTRSRGTRETNGHLHRSQEQLQVTNSEPVLDYNWFLQKKIMSFREHKLVVNCTMLIFNFPFSCPLCPQLVETWYSRQRKYLLSLISPHP